MNFGEAFSALKELSESKRVFFAIKEEIPFAGECQIKGLSEEGFWVSFEGGFKSFFWRLDVDGLRFEKRTLSDFVSEEQTAIPATSMFTPGLLIVAPDGRSLFLMEPLQ